MLEEKFKNDSDNYIKDIEDLQKENEEINKNKNVSKVAINKNKLNYNIIKKVLFYFYIFFHFLLNPFFY